PYHFLQAGGKKPCSLDSWGLVRKGYLSMHFSGHKAIFRSFLKKKHNRTSIHYTFSPHQSDLSHFSAPFLIAYIKPISSSEMNTIISTKPAMPISLKFTAHGYMKITSTSKSTNRIATRKYRMCNGIRALPFDGTPHSNDSSFTLVLRIGPSKCVTTMVPSTKADARANISKTGMYPVTKSFCMLSSIMRTFAVALRVI